MSNVSNAIRFLRVYEDLARGELVRPRGMLCREVLDYSFDLDMHDSPLTSFKARNLSLKYAKEEFKWYLRADKFDTSIEQHASLWQKIRQPDESYFSNYGQYIFPGQFSFVCQELVSDRDSRRASIVLLKQEHLFRENRDVVCTYAINFRIRNNRLDMTVMMRSNDAIFGMTNDVFCFAMIYRMVYAMIEFHLPVDKGIYRHFVNSLHVYERHFTMLHNILDEGIRGYEEVEIPWPTCGEVEDAVIMHAPRQGAWADWLMR